ncbi:hypothetical protein Q8F57_018685 [Paraburkholderia terrae]|uniref:hypothetical protein n=1 Tax=Paraburkholderia terrae TaxID=311230 RepID=UPI00296ABC14|nr:hypothetical protein [Paraburkholderia terrae]MDW3655127.1 hypothetical protein [Paraburkholderia terrae]
MKLFRELTADEEREFRQWAREHYKPFEPINGVWHWVTQAECVQINRTADIEPELDIRKTDEARF